MTLLSIVQLYSGAGVCFHLNFKMAWSSKSSTFLETRRSPENIAHLAQGPCLARQLSSPFLVRASIIRAINHLEKPNLHQIFRIWIERVNNFDHSFNSDTLSYHGHLSFKQLLDVKAELPNVLAIVSGPKGPLDDHLKVVGARGDIPPSLLAGGQGPVGVSEVDRPVRLQEHLRRAAILILQFFQLIRLILASDPEQRGRGSGS
mmetsp:Transcript_17815/g.51004  ORF Transcript_17815/g.51004 Transcript_17815/m.51004 type:complete len:204 (-) Transcript_17815:217-828(-)